MTYKLAVLPVTVMTESDLTDIEWLTSILTSEVGAYTHLIDTSLYHLQRCLHCGTWNCLPSDIMSSL